MKICTLFQLTLVAALQLALLSTSTTFAAQDTAAPPARVEGSLPDEVQQALRANLLLQDQVHNLQRSLEDYRQLADTSAKRSEEALTSRFGTIEKSLDEQRRRELETSRTMMFVAGAFAVAGLAAILITSWLQLRTAQRLTEVSASLRQGMPLALGEGIAPGEAAVALSRQRYTDEVERLQRRVHELEHSNAPLESRAGNGHPTSEAGSTPVTPKPSASGQSASSIDAQVAVLLGKGQTFLNLDQSEKALACFEEALALDPDHLDGLIKRGAALERLQRFDDAIAVYDRVIGLDERQTTAYLLKGGVFNRLKRFNDALACYDQALKTQPPRKG